MRRLSRSLPSVCLHTHATKRDYDCEVCEYVFQDNMLRSEPEFDPSSKEINISERRDGMLLLLGCCQLSSKIICYRLGFVFFQPKERIIFDFYTLNQNAPFISNRQSRFKTMTLNLLFILLMFLVTCGAELCEPVSKSKCCDPEVQIVFCFSKIFLSNMFLKSNV